MNNKSFKKLLSSYSILIVGIVLLSSSSVFASTVGTSPVNLDTAGNYAILAKSGISSVPNSVITGNIGVGPIAATAMTGFSLTEHATNEFSVSNQIIGKAYAADYAPTASQVTTAISNMEKAYTDAAGRAVNYPELYAGDITQAAGTRINLKGGIQAKNIFWQSAETVAIGTDAHFEGNILGMTNITLCANASIHGRLLAQTAVTLIKNTVVAPSAPITKWSQLQSALSAGENPAITDAARDKIAAYILLMVEEQYSKISI